MSQKQNEEERAMGRYELCILTEQQVQRPGDRNELGVFEEQGKVPCGWRTVSFWGRSTRTVKTRAN